MAPPYTVAQLQTIEEVKELIVTADKQMNWLVLSTSGVHGTYATLDQIEQNMIEDDEDPHYQERALDENGNIMYFITVLIIQPRRCTTYYGHVQIQRTDIPWLRQAVTESLAGIERSQRENVLKV